MTQLKIHGNIIFEVRIGLPQRETRDLRRTIFLYRRALSTPAFVHWKLVIKLNVFTGKLEIFDRCPNVSRIVIGVLPKRAIHIREIHSISLCVERAVLALLYMTFPIFWLTKYPIGASLFSSRVVFISPIFHSVFWSANHRYTPRLYVTTNESESDWSLPSFSPLINY